MDFGEIVSVLFQGAIVTVEIVAMALPLAVLMAFGFGLIRLYAPAPFKQIAIVYIEFFEALQPLFNCIGFTSYCPFLESPLML
ncbi:hypothetical protein N5P32_04520 [Marinomonas pontica]|uniref:hypothetical protein n=1 Tax=Marinomonas pontica TaxID=264739 RepID=UPI002243F842|nr:hypothetical protein [Marinomonas pontica]MCW8355210.1 hypothetical protein [Marinomonas pontica]